MVDLVGAEDGGGHLVGFEAVEEDLVALGGGLVALAAIAADQVVVGLQVLRVDREGVLELLDGAVEGGLFEADEAELVADEAVVWKDADDLLEHAGGVVEAAVAEERLGVEVLG